MTYTEQLAQAKKINLDIGQIMIAYEVEGAFSLEHPQFEHICAIAYDYWLHSEYATDSQIVWAIKTALESGLELEDLTHDIICDHIEW